MAILTFMNKAGSKAFDPVFLYILPSHDFSFGGAIDKFLQLKKQVEWLYKEVSRRNYLDYLFL